MGCITAPVAGSGDWPAWMARVLKPWRVSLVFMADAPGSLLQAQAVQEIAACDETEETVAVHDGHGGLDLHEGVQHVLTLAHVDTREVGVEGAAHLLGEAALVTLHRLDEIDLAHRSQEVLAFYDRQLGDAVVAHAGMGGEERISGTDVHRGTLPVGAPHVIAQVA